MERRARDLARVDLELILKLLAFAVREGCLELTSRGGRVSERTTFSDAPVLMQTSIQCRLQSLRRKNAV